MKQKKKTINFVVYSFGLFLKMSKNGFVRGFSIVKSDIART